MTEPATRPNLLRFVSFNTRTPNPADLGNRWEKRKEWVAEFIRDALRPDVIGLQECHHGQAVWLAERLPEYDWVGVGRSDGREKGEMVPIFHRRDRLERLDACHFWLSETPEKPGSRSWLTSLPRMCTWARFQADGGETCVFNTHFDHVSGRARRKGAELIRSRAAEVKVPTVVMGDFNAAPGSPPHAALLDGEPHLRDAGADSNVGTFHNFTGKPGSRIDWILTTPHWQNVTYAVDRTERDGRYPSDHFPIVVEASMAAAE